jgi:hypothetical protein
VPSPLPGTASSRVEDEETERQSQAQSNHQPVSRPMRIWNLIPPQSVKWLLGCLLLDVCPCLQSMRSGPGADGTSTSTHRDGFCDNESLALPPMSPWLRLVANEKLRVKQSIAGEYLDLDLALGRFLALLCLAGRAIAEVTVILCGKRSLSRLDMRWQCHSVAQMMGLPDALACRGKGV